jgi:hypothetical protein
VLVLGELAAHASQWHAAARDVRRERLERPQPFPPVPARTQRPPSPRRVHSEANGSNPSRDRSRAGLARLRASGRARTSNLCLWTRSRASARAAASSACTLSVRPEELEPPAFCPASLSLNSFVVDGWWFESLWRQAATARAR